MKTWRIIKLRDHIERGLTEEGHRFWLAKLQGWNHEDLSDIDDIAIIRAVLVEDTGSVRLSISVDYKYEDSKKNVAVRKLVAEAKEQVKETIADDL